MKRNKTAKTVRLSADAISLLTLLEGRFGVSQAAIWEMAIRQLAKDAGVKLPTGMKKKAR